MSTKGHRPVVVVTGATGGLGAAIVSALTAAGCDVVAVVRSAARFDALKATLPTRGKLDLVVGDLGMAAGVAAVGATLAARPGTIDVLINNAGVHAFSQRITGDGLPVMVAVNHVAPFVLTHALLPRLRESQGRIVNVASDAHRRVKTLSLPDDLTSTSPFGAVASSQLYSRSKLLSVLFTRALARRLEGSGVTVNSCCPGLNTTGLGREHRGFAALARVFRALGLFPPERGARIVSRLALDSSLSATSGQHFSASGEVKPATPLVRDVELQERLWEATASLPALAALGEFA